MTEDEVRGAGDKRLRRPLDGFRSKLGKPFSATLKLDENFALKFHFGDGQDSSDRKPENLAEAPVVAKMPALGDGAVQLQRRRVGGDRYGLCLPQRLFARKEVLVQAREKHALARNNDNPELRKAFASTGKTPVIDDFVSKRTKKKFSAALALDQKGGISFEFAKKIRKGGQ